MPSRGQIHSGGSIDTGPATTAVTMPSSMDKFARTEVAADRGAQGHLGQIAPCGSDQVYARALEWSDDVPDRRAGGGGYQHGRTLDASDRTWKKKLIVQWQRRRCRKLGDFGFGTEHGKTQRARSADLSLRRA